MSDITHDELVKRAVRWMKNSYGCGVAVPELVTYAKENPDAVGWKDNGQTTVIIECKTSKSDYIADQEKTTRRNPKLCAGDIRYYFTPPNLLRPDEIDPVWGLLECGTRSVKKIKEAIRVNGDPQESKIMMYSLLRRVEVRGDLNKCLAYKWRGDCRLGVKDDQA